MFSLTVLEILLSEGGSVLFPAQRRTWSKRVKVSIKNQNDIGNLLTLLEKWFTYGIRRFWMVFKFFWFGLYFLLEKQKKMRIYWNCLKSDWFRRFGMVSIFFWFCLTLSVSEKLKNSIFEMLIITQDLNINNLRTRSGKSINLHIIKKLVDYSLKDAAAKVMFIFTVLQILMSEDRSLLRPSQRGTVTERVKVLVKNPKNIVNLLKFLEKWLN